MTEKELRRKILINSISNYVRLVLRLGLGLLMFRMLYPNPDATGIRGGLSQEEFGFWALLWSIFGYGLLMDFGFGLAAQKKVAELSHHKNWDELSRVLSTIIYFYCMSGLLIVIATLVSSHWLIQLLSITPANEEYFRQVLVLFLCFIGASFPTGIAVEILYGQQRIALANNLGVIANIINFGLIAYGLHHGWRLKAIIVCAMMCAIVPSIIGGWMGLRSLPGVKILPRYFSWKMVRETMRFSIFAYIGLVTQIIMGQTDRLILSVFMSVSAVAVYQAGAKVADIFTGFTGQVPETISPAAAHLSATGDKGALQRLLMDSSRFNVMVGTPLFILCAFYMEGLLHLLTKGQAFVGETFWVGEVLLLWCYSLQITHSITKKVFMMCGHEKRLTQLSVIEALLNLVLTVTLVLCFKSVLSVAIGSLIPSLIIGWGYLWPWAAKDAGVDGWQLAGRVLFRNWLACLPLVVFGLACRLVPALDFRDNTPLFLVESVVAGLIAAVGVWKWALTTEEREKILGKISKITGRFLRRNPA